MDENNVSIIFCTGAFHTNIHVQPATGPLEKAGYRVIACPMVSAHGSGEWEEDVSNIESATKAELRSGHHMALILHSAAGPVGCEAVNRVFSSNAYDNAKILKMIFVASLVRQDEAAKIYTNPLMSGYFRIGTGHEAGYIFADDAQQAFFNDMTPEDAGPYIKALGKQKAYQQPDVVSEQWKAIPAAYVLCTRDNVALPEDQQWIAQRHGMHISRVEAGHDPFISRPEEFVHIIDSIIKT
jgi:hypothetical protein